MKLLYVFLGIFIGVFSSTIWRSIVRWVEGKRGPINCFDDIVWPAVDDPRWRMVNGWLILGDVRCCTMTNMNEQYIFGVDFQGYRIRNGASIRYCEAVKQAILARSVMKQIEDAT